ncbi:response regulator [Sphingobacterium daejeonense]|uniref:Response regulator n=1 Tax=Sphingobacterium daejeonense TaxID=371142 RepID=A0ABW3RN23_9SPHI|nr:MULTISPECIES: response regulator transcription factor [Sphingobacterium]MCT1530492.1 response regulator transcription factor [Sphingobacterium daejeonense]
MNEIKIALMDDESLFIEGLSLLIERIPNCKVVYKNSDSSTLMDDFYSLPEIEIPDILLLDIQMEPISGLELVEKILPNFPKVKILILSSHYKSNMIGHMLKLGVSGFLPKVIDTETLKNAIQTVYQTGVYVSASDYQLLHQYLNNPNKKVSFDLKDQLTEREIEVIRLICEEYTNIEIAEQLFLSKRTVESHRQRILDKLGLKNTVGLVIYALANEIFVPKK